MSFELYVSLKDFGNYAKEIARKASDVIVAMAIFRKTSIPKITCNSESSILKSNVFQVLPILKYKKFKFWIKSEYFTIQWSWRLFDVTFPGELEEANPSF